MKNMPERSPDRIGPVINRIEELWRLRPEWRFGQMLYVVLPSIYYMFTLEDDKLLEVVNKRIEIELNRINNAPRGRED